MDQATDSEQLIRHFLEQVGRPGWTPEDVAFLINHEEFEHRPVGIREFVTSPLYMNAAEECWPAVLEDLEDIFSEPVDSMRLSRYSEVVREMGIGAGKSFRVSYMFCYAAYRLLCYKEPAMVYGLARDTTIALVNISLSAPQAKKVVFGDVVVRVRNSPWFQAHAQPDPNVLSELRFPKGVVIFPASSSETAPLGYTIFMANIDEAAFFTQTDERDSAQEIHDAITNRSASRFSGLGLISVISSPRYEGDFIERKVEEARLNPLVSGKRSETWRNRPADIRAIAGGDFFELAHPREKDAAGCARIVRIPRAYEAAFRKNLQRAWRDFGAVASLVLEPYMSAEDIARLEEVIARSPENLVRGGRMDPALFERGVEYFAHVDIGLRRDALGLVVASRRGGTVRLEAIARIVSERRARELEAAGQPWDMVIGRDEVNLEAVRGLLYALSDAGVWLSAVSFDGFQSVDSRQQLEARGYRTELISVDRDLRAYDTFKDLLASGRLECCAHAHYLLEFRRLELVEGRKVDHPPHGSKDLADAGAGVCRLIAEGMDELAEEEEVLSDDSFRVRVTDEI